MPKCYILVGMPASGKSTFAAKWPVHPETTFLSTDDIIEMIAYDYGTTYDRIFKNAIGLAEQIFWTKMENAKKQGLHIVVDRTNLTKKSRRRIMDMLPGYEFHSVFFPTPPENEWERRLNSREGKTIPREALERMMNSYQQPTIEEGFSSVTLMDDFAHELVF